MSEARYRDLVSCLPLGWVAILDSASTLLRARLDEGKPCGLADLARAYPLARGGVGSPAVRALFGAAWPLLVLSKLVQHSTRVADREKGVCDNAVTKFPSSLNI